MSILLDALRKSEKDQHKPEVPGIYSGEQQGPVSSSLKKGLLVFLLCVGLSAIAWFVWYQYQKPAGSYQPPVTLVPETATVVSDPIVKPQAGDGRKTQSVASIKPVNGTADRRRTPVESYQEASVDDSKPKAGSGGRLKPKAEPKAKPDAQPKPALETQLLVKSSAGDNRQPATGKPASDKPAVATQKEFRPERPAPISYWELPDAIRAGVPEIKFSVLVYSKHPSERFVLINGQRYGQGDQLPSGPIVTKIRREGVVFRYRLYLFLVER